MNDALPAWPRRLAVAAIAGVGLSMLVAVLSRVRDMPPFHVGLGSFFLSFAALKYCVAMEAVHRLRAVRLGRPDPRDTERSQVSWPVVVYKFAACAVAMAAGIYILTIGADKVNRIFAG